MMQELEDTADSMKRRRLLFELEIESFELDADESAAIDAICELVTADEHEPSPLSTIEVEDRAEVVRLLSVFPPCDGPLGPGARQTRTMERLSEGRWPQ